MFSPLLWTISLFCCLLYSVTRFSLINLLLSSLFSSPLCPPLLSLPPPSDYFNLKDTHPNYAVVTVGYNVSLSQVKNIWARGLTSEVILITSVEAGRPLQMWATPSGGGLILKKGTWQKEDYLLFACLASLLLPNEFTLWLLLLLAIPVSILEAAFPGFCRWMWNTNSPTTF